jgi:LemA protein
MKIILVVFVLLALTAVFVILTYNSLIALKNRVKEAWSDIEVQLKRRYDLIPNIVETVKGYAKHESSTFENVVNARNVASGNHGTPSERAQAENALSGALKSLFAVVEGYPDLKANVNFLNLQQELTDTEDKIKASRRFYNTNALALNNKVEMFPSNIIAGYFKFGKAEFFELDDEEKEAAQKPVQVKF